jgi:hypothetical protein
MSATTLASPAVTAFADAVRHALADLPADEVDDLTDGLEADLTERLDDVDAAELGDPVAYAEELRLAAGLPLPSRAHNGIAASIAELRRVPLTMAEELRTRLQRSPALAGLATFLVALRPVWWVLRALAVTAVLSYGLGGSPVNIFTLLFGIVALVVSVQFGRGRWLPFAWMRALLLAFNVILAVATPFVILGWAMQVNNAAAASSYSSMQDFSFAGLTENGNPVSNIFAYDAQGQPLSNVQLFDQDGRPLNLVGDPTMGSVGANADGSVTVPNEGVAGRLGWNVFPLGSVSADAVNDDGTVKSSATPIPATPPFAAAKPIAGSDPTPSPSATATAPSSPAP